MDDLQRRVAETAEQLLRVAVERAVCVTADMRVSEADAAELVGYAAGSFKNLRSMQSGPPFFNRPLAGSRVSYRLSDLAQWIEQSREATL
jgi:hypothetical protein